MFNIGSGGELTVSDGQDIPSRTWVAYADADGTVYVALWDGKTSVAVCCLTLMSSRCYSADQLARQYQYHCRAGHGASGSGTGSSSGARGIRTA